MNFIIRVLIYLCVKQEMKVGEVALIFNIFSMKKNSKRTRLEKFKIFPFEATFDTLCQNSKAAQTLS